MEVALSGLWAPAPSYPPQVNKSSRLLWRRIERFPSLRASSHFGGVARSHTRAARERTQEFVRLRRSLARSLRTPSQAKGFPKSYPCNIP